MFAITRAAVWQKMRFSIIYVCGNRISFLLFSSTVTSSCNSARKRGVWRILSLLLKAMLCYYNADAPLNKNVYTLPQDKEQKELEELLGLIERKKKEKKNSGGSSSA